MNAHTFINCFNNSETQVEMGLTVLLCPSNKAILTTTFRPGSEVKYIMQQGSAVMKGGLNASVFKSIASVIFRSQAWPLRAFQTSGHLFVRKNYNAPHPPGKSWSTIDRALKNGSQLFGGKHIVKTKTVSSQKGT